MNIPENLRDRIVAARHVFVLTGAGISAESGIETFRGEDGTWSKVNIEQVATADGFYSDPAFAWQWYDDKRQSVANSAPNAAHQALVNMEELFDSLIIGTQNIDGFHSAAGSSHVIEMHGSMWKVQDSVTEDVYEDLTVPLEEFPPFSPAGNLLRPAVVWFGEMLPSGAIETCFQAATNCDLCLVVGTSGVVQPAASFPLHARASGAVVLEFSLEETELTPHVDHSFFGKAGTMLPEFVEYLNSHRC